MFSKWTKHLKHLEGSRFYNYQVELVQDAVGMQDHLKRTSEYIVTNLPKYVFSHVNTS